MGYIVTCLAAFLFGVGDQYLGSLARFGAWTTEVSLLSAPWLLVPFLAGASQVLARRGALIGLMASCSALAGYFLMIMGPFEGGHSAFDLAEAHGLLVSNKLNIVGALLTGPLYGFLGQTWRTRRALSSAALVAGAFLLEPAVLQLFGRLRPGELLVPLCEVLAGLLSLAYLGIDWRRRTASRPAAPRRPWVRRLER